MSFTSASVLAVVAATVGCYDTGSSPAGEGPPGRFDDRNDDGVPDQMEEDPSLDDNDRDPTDNPPGDFDADGIEDDIDVDDDNDWILDAVPRAPLVAALRPIARADCEKVASCCSVGWSAAAVEHCAIETTGRVAVALAQGWVDGWVTVDEQGLDDCLSAQDFDCDVPPPRARRMPFECRQYLVGHRSPRSACNRTVECDAGTFCTGDITLGDQPNELGPGPYDIDFWDGAPGSHDGMCLSYAAEEEACDPSRGPICSGGFKCQESDAGNWCVEVAGEGEECAVAGTRERADNCASGLFCSADAVSCLGLAPGGTACLEGRECSSGSCNGRSQLCDDALPLFDYCAEGVAFE
jgi:hypothetical protein